MTAVSAGRAPSTTTIGGALVALAGLLPLLHELGSGGLPALVPIAEVALAVGAIALAAAPRGVAGRSPAGRGALVVLGVVPLAFLVLPETAFRASVVAGLSLTALLTAATVVAAASVARARVLHGPGRWLLVVVAADALLVAAMSTVPLGALPLRYLEWHLELIRPIVLLVWGVCVVLHENGPALRRRAAAFDDAWRRSTDVGGAESTTREARTARR